MLRCGGDDRRRLHKQPSATNYGLWRTAESPGSCSQASHSDGTTAPGRPLPTILIMSYAENRGLQRPSAATAQPRPWRPASQPARSRPTAPLCMADTRMYLLRTYLHMYAVRRTCPRIGAEYGAEKEQRELRARARPGSEAWTSHHPLGATSMPPGPTSGGPNSRKKRNRTAGRKRGAGKIIETSSSSATRDGRAKSKAVGVVDNIGSFNRNRALAPELEGCRQAAS